MENQERKPLLASNNSSNNRFRKDLSSGSSSDGDNWSDGSSSSYYSDSGSSVPEWEPSVQDDGELVYIVCDLKKDSAKPGLLSKADNNVSTVDRGGFTRQSVRRSSRGKLLKLLKRRNSTRSKPKSNKEHKSGHVENQPVKNQNSNADATNASKVTFIESQDGEVKELVMEVNFANRLKYGRRISQIESLFGFSINTFDDGKRVMVSGILPEGQAINQRQIKIGDWLKKIDHQDVTSDNIEQILSIYPEEKKQVKLVLQRVAATEVSQEILDKSNSTYSDLVRHLTDATNEHEIVLTQILRDLAVSVLYLTSEGLSENGPENDGVLYCYPRPEKHNFLCTSRGTFITLNHLIPEICKQWKPSSSAVFVKDSFVNIAYTSRGNELLLLALPDKKCNLFELKHINRELVRMLEFCYQSLDKCFKSGENVKKLDHLFSRLFAQILTCGYGWDCQNGVRLENIRLLSESPSQPLFEQCLPMAQAVNLPWEAQLQIDDALTELEAADYREWNDDPFDCQRLFVVIGTCLYYSGHLLVSHFQEVDLLDIHSFLRMQGFLSISRDESVQNLIVWKEVFVSSCNRGMRDDTGPQTNGIEIYKVPHGRWFIVIIGKGKLLLVTLLEAGLATVKAEGTILPEPFYVEECESCLDLLIDVGLDKFLQQWFHCNARPQVLTQPELLLPKAKNNRDSGFAAAFNKKVPSPVSKKSPEIQSILKRRHHSNDHISSGTSGNDESFNTSPIQLQGNISSHHPTTSSMSNLDITFSEDSGSQKSTSEIGEERVEGRRVAREREQRLNRNSLSSDSDAEWDACEANSQYSGGYDLSDLSQSLLEKMDLALPTKITAGMDNVCFHYIRLDCERGVLLAPTVHVQKQSESELYKHILENFRRASQKIHTLLQNTIRFKKMLSPSSSVNKSLVAIKEHGILFDVPAKFFGQTSSSKKVGESFSYWVIGRLFENQQSSEVYVCCHDSVPQNIVEIAFRLGLNY